MKTICVCLLTSFLISTVQSNIKILDTLDGGEHPEPCALTCSGISRHDDPDFLHGWIYLNPFQTVKVVNIAGCGFVSPPVVSAAINNNLCAGIKTYSTEKERFAVITFEEITVDEMRSKKCDVSWIAVGYNC